MKSIIREQNNFREINEKNSECQCCVNNCQCKNYSKVQIPYVICNDTFEAYNAVKFYILEHKVIASLDIIPETGQIKVAGHYNESFADVESQHHWFSLFMDKTTFSKYYDYNAFLVDLSNL